MRYLQIAQFLLCFQVALALVNYADTYTTEITPAQEWIDDVSTEEVQDATFFQNLLTNIAEAVATFVGFVKGFWYFIKVVGWGVIWFPKTLIDFGLDSTVAGLMAVPVYFTYFVAVAQWLSGRQTEAMQ